MFGKKECVAMILAGGQGSRLYALTNKLAKPAVIYGAKYRIIDFPLSNCVNSNIDTVGVLTQYQPLILNEYIGNGEPWDLDRSFGGVHVLPPYQAKNKNDWYKGTANAIFQNINFIEKYAPQYVLVLSGDHIYKMDYSKMLQYHKEKDADLTIAVIEVEIDEASRFGIMNTNDDNRIYEFEEKPATPKSTKASMGIYIFNTNILFEYLRLDEANNLSQNDFGKNIIPRMIDDGLNVYAYPFSGYWKDVGTIQSLLEANFDLLGENPKFSLNDEQWPIYSRNYSSPPHYIGQLAYIKNSLITSGCNIEGTIINSIIASNVQIKKDVHIENSVIHDSCVIKSGAKIVNAIIDSEVVVGENATIGDNDGITVIGHKVRIEENQNIKAGSIIEEGIGE